MGLVGKRADGFWVEFEFMAARLPTLHYHGVIRRSWAWWASGRMVFGLSLSSWPPAYPPYIIMGLQEDHGLKT